MTYSTLEQRKLNYILSKIDIEAVNRHFSRVDKFMQSLKVGDKVYERDTFGDLFEFSVVEILDTDNGMVEVVEAGHKNSVTRCIAEFCNYSILDSFD